MNEHVTTVAKLATYFEDMQHSELQRLSKKALTKINREEKWIAICGHFSAGKSTLLNEWLGKGVLPTSPIPTSANIVSIRSGKTDAAAVAVNDHDWVALDFTQFGQLSTYCKVEEINEVELELSAFPFGENVVLMDTPGIDSTDERHREATEKSLFLADHLFFMMDYNHVQSAQNIQLMKRFSREGRPYSIIINQIDKHNENELTFVSFRETLRQAFERHDIRPDDLFFISLKERTHVHNELERLNAHVEHVLSAQVDIAEQASLMAVSLVDKATTHTRRELEELPDVEESVDSLEMELERLQTVRNDLRLNRFKQEWVNRVRALVDQAPLMPFEFRELLKQYLEAKQPTFKVGFLFSADKTRQERERREQLVEREWQALFAAHVLPHLLKLARECSERYALPAEFAAFFETIEPPSRAVIDSEIKSGTDIGGDALLQFCRDVEHSLARHLIRITSDTVDAANRVIEQNAKRREEETIAEQARIQQLLDALNERTRLQERLTLLTDVDSLPLSPDWEQQLLKRNYVDAPLEVERKQMEAEVAVTSEVSHTLEHLDFSFSYEQSVCEILERTPMFARKASGLRRKIERARAQTFTLAVFGAFSAGKSSTLNALLGEAVLPTSPNPLTASITKITPPTDEHPHRTARIRFKTEATLQTALEAYGASLNRLDGDHPFVQAVQNAPLELLGTTRSVDYDTFCRFVTEEAKSCIVEEIELFYDSVWSREGIQFVDTPGADSQFNRHSEVQFAYMRDADAVLFVTYYNHAFTEADRELIIQLGRMQGTTQLDKMFFLVNAADLAHDDEEKASVADYVRTQLTRYGVRRPNLHAVSSRNALHGHDDDFDRFSDELRHFVSEELRLEHAHAIREEAAHMVTQLTHLVEEQRQDSAIKQRRLAELAEIETMNFGLDGHSIRQKIEREANELLLHLEKRTLLRVNDFVKESFHPIHVAHKSDLPGALKRFLDKYAFDVHQELQVFTYRLERFAAVVLDEQIARMNESVQEQLPQFSFEPELTVTWYRELPLTASFVDQRFEPLLKHFKNAESFFEKGGRERLRDALVERLREELYPQFENIRERVGQTTSTEVGTYVSTFDADARNEHAQTVADERTLLTEDGSALEQLYTDIASLANRVVQM